jgi:hypothetical protein
MAVASPSVPCPRIARVDLTTPLRQIKRAGRVSVGLIRPQSRPAYKEAIRRKLKRPTRQARSKEKCLVCNSRTVDIKTVTRRKAPPKTFAMQVCRTCGHVANPTNLHDYRKFSKLEALPLRARIGTADRKGREYYMAELGVGVLNRDDLSVIVHGAGRSFDNHHIAALPQVREVAVSDVMKLRDDAEFFDATRKPSRTFSLVLASEVVEHFLAPRADFPILFSFVEDDGLVILSTNLYDGQDLSKQPYIFIEGHTSYYTPKALEFIAAEHGFHVAFRTPLVATGYGGPRKRYVLFSRSQAVMDRLADYLPEGEYAPSERPWANKELEATLAEERAAAKAHARASNG